MTTVRLALAGNRLPTRTEIPEDGEEFAPAALVSYFYLQHFSEEKQKSYVFRDWVMDSGAFSAWNSGKEIDLVAYTEKCGELLARDKRLTEVFALDVIGDWRASLKNTDIMWSKGVPAMPTFHPGEPWDVLVEMARGFPKIALGGVVGWPRKKKESWISQCFTRAWPARIHGLGMCGESMLTAFPFHSVDATNWFIGPRGFGRWSQFGFLPNARGIKNLRPEIDAHLKLERQAKQRWSREMTLLSTLPTTRRA